MFETYTVTRDLTRHIVMIGFIFLLTLGSAGGAAHCGNGHPELCTTIPPGQVDQAIVNINLHYNNDLCLEILLIDCTKHVTAGDEIVCGSNFKTYENHCHFAHARCEHFLVDKPGTLELRVLHTGSCIASTTAKPVVTTTVPATNAVINTGSVQPIVTTTTTIPKTSTTMATTTTTQVMTTSTIAIGPIFQDLFCKNINNISCNNGFNIICGSDGQFYPNSCELSKAKCKDSALTVDTDTSHCNLP